MFIPVWLRLPLADRKQVVAVSLRAFLCAALHPARRQPRPQGRPPQPPKKKVNTDIYTHIYIYIDFYTYIYIYAARPPGSISSSSTTYRNR